MRTFLFGDTSRPDPDYPLSPVPRTARRGLISISVVLLGFTFFYPTMFAGAQLGWFGVTVALMAKPFVDWLGLDWANTGTMVFWCFIWSAAFTSTAYFGYKGMELLSLIAVPLILLLGAIMAVKSFAHARETAGGITAILPDNRMGFAAAMTMIVGTFASGGTQAPNWARFARNRSVAFWASMIAFLFGNGRSFSSAARSVS